MPGILRSLLRLLAIVLPCTLAAAASAASIDNQASARYSDPQLGYSAPVQSNRVSSVLNLPPPTIRFFTDAGYATAARATASGSPLFLQIDAAACNQDPAAIETLTISVRSTATGDAEQYTATETAAGSGKFRVQQAVWTKDASIVPPTAGDTMLSVMKGDALDASIAGCGAGSVQARLLIDPAGVVFDSLNNHAIAGATVRLIDTSGAGNGGKPGSAAQVFLYDGITPAPSTVVTGADGRYQFPLVAPSSYRLLVTPPGDYSFPSRRAPGLQPAGRTIHLYGSYGADFAVDASTGPVTLDVPLDANPSGLFVQKTASRTSAEIAESVLYTVLVKNVSGMTVDGVSLRDDLPAGFAYVPGSARQDGVAIADPQGGRGPSLGFTLGALADNTGRSLSYRVLIGPGALHGDGINRAQARATAPADKLSNVATATVKVEGGVFSDKGFVLGKVYADCNGNGLQDAGEAGIPGVRLLLEDGSFVVTDGQGRYSFYGLTARTHVLKVDPATLPDGVRLAPISARHAGDGATRFVDLQRGELQRADFASAGCAAGLADAIVARRAKVGGVGRELEQGLKNELKADGSGAPRGDARALPASGVIGAADDEASVHPAAASASASTSTSTSPSTSAPRDPASTLAELLSSVTGELGFIGLHDGDILKTSQIRVRTHGRARVPLVLELNGQPVPESRIGTRVQSAPSNTLQTEAREYVGVDLRAGDNTLSLVQHDGFGNERARTTLHVVAPGPLARIVVIPPERATAADGEAIARVRVRLEDARGLPVAARTAVTLHTTLGRWQVVDLDARAPGVQTFVEGGEAEFGLRSPSTPGDAELRVASDAQAGQARVAFTLPLRPLVGAGVIEGVLNLRKLDAGALLPARRQDGFEEELRQFARSGDADARARAALFLKGRIRGDYLLTLGYDSDKDTRERLFRDIQPDQFYPVYGDSAVRGFDAQSTSRLYVRIDKNKSYLLHGDFTTQAASPVRTLGAYERSLTGLKQHLETDRLALNLFASRDSTRQVVDELRANGTSGPYLLRTGNGLANSEKVEILTRDRNQPAVVIKAVPQQRFADYEIESLSGRLLFRAPVPSLDADLNPISIRITYEVDQGGPAFWVGGVDAQLKVSESVEVGASLVDDRNPQDALRLASANARLQLGDKTTLSAEVAQSDRASLGTGRGERVEFRHEGQTLQARVFAGRTDANFDNPSASLSRGRSEAGAKASLALNEQTRLVAEALHSGDATSGAQRDGVQAGIERSVAMREGMAVKLEVGLRQVREVTAATRTATETTSARVKLTADVPLLERGTVYGEAEQDVHDASRRMLAVGGEAGFGDGNRLYWRHELISSLSGPYALDANQRQTTTLIGVDAAATRDGRVFSEYRVRDALAGRDAEAAIGLRKLWTLAEGVRLNTSVERVQALSGSDANETAALTGALELTSSPLWKGTARLELRRSAASDGLLSTLGLALKLSDDWTALAKNVFALSDNKNGQPDKLQERLQLGMAYRDSATNRLNGLARYEFKHEKDGTEPDALRRVHMLSAHLDFQPTRPLTLTAQLAAKRADESIAGITVRGSAQLLGVRATRDLGARWDAGLAARALVGAGWRSRQTGVGAELGYRVADNLWLSAGVNVTGFHDRDLSAEDTTQRGAYLRLRFKFDETLWAKK